MASRASGGVQPAAIGDRYTPHMRTRLTALAAALAVGVSAIAVAALIPSPTGATPADRSGRGHGDNHGRGDDAPLVIGHRGASGYRPEHTLGAYQLAIDLGADYVEPDLVSTSDGVLVARHENEIGGTTDVAAHPEFADRRTTKVIDGTSITGWFTEDFTLAELKTLRAVERIPAIRPGNTNFDGEFEVPTLQEVLDLVAEANSARAPEDRIGVYPETKHPSYFDGIGLSLEEPLVATLRANGYTRPTDPVFIQSFEVSNLQDLNRMTRLSIVQLINGSGRPFDFTLAGDPRTYADMATPAGLREIASYADGVGPTKTLVIPVAADGNLGTPTTLVRDAHRAGLTVHIWTMRNENSFVPPALRTSTDPSQRGQVEAEYAAYWATGIDGLFSDNPDTAVATRTAFLAGR
jgi:glycerophosphoryl diester phosphodiesterase